jgi:hypothetical protein
MPERDRHGPDEQNAREERRRRRAYNELLVKVMSKMNPQELQRFGDRLLKRYLKPRQ